MADDKTRLEERLANLEQENRRLWKEIDLRVNRWRRFVRWWNQTDEIVSSIGSLGCLVVLIIGFIGLVGGILAAMPSVREGKWHDALGAVGGALAASLGVAAVWASGLNWSVIIGLIIGAGLISAVLSAGLRNIALAIEIHRATVRDLRNRPDEDDKDPDEDNEDSDEDDEDSDDGWSV